MIPVGQPYRPSGTPDIRSILITSILGVSAAVIGAAIVWLWELSRIPTLVILTPLLQGLAVGLVMAFAIGRLRLRNPLFVTAVALACGLLSSSLVHYGHYVHMVSTTAGQLRGRSLRINRSPRVSGNRCWPSSTPTRAVSSTRCSSSRRTTRASSVRYSCGMRKVSHSRATSSQERCSGSCGAPKPSWWPCLPR